MNIVNENEKWVSNMISILFYAVIINLSHFFNDEMNVYDIIFFYIFNLFRHFKKLFKAIFWSLHYCSKIVLFMLCYYFVFSIANFHVHLSFVENATFAFQTSCFLDYIDAFLRSFKFCSFVKFNSRCKLFYRFFESL